MDTEVLPDDDPVVNGQRFCEDRRANDDKLKLRFEHIFRKYERDFTEIGDEIDLATGEIIIDNGHLESMEHEIDAGDESSEEAEATPDLVDDETEVVFQHQVSQIKERTTNIPDDAEYSSSGYITEDDDWHDYQTQSFPDHHKTPVSPFRHPNVPGDSVLARILASSGSVRTSQHIEAKEPVWQVPDLPSRKRDRSPSSVCERPALTSSAALVTTSPRASASIWKKQRRPPRKRVIDGEVSYLLPLSDEEDDSDDESSQERMVRIDEDPFIQQPTTLECADWEVPWRNPRIQWDHDGHTTKSSSVRPLAPKPIAVPMYPRYARPEEAPQLQAAAPKVRSAPAPLPDRLHPVLPRVQQSGPISNPVAWQELAEKHLGKLLVNKRYQVLEANVPVEKPKLRAFTEQEDERLLKMHQQGMDFHDMRRYFEHRDATSLSNRYAYIRTNFAPDLLEPARPINRVEKRADTARRATSGSLDKPLVITKKGAAIRHLFKADVHGKSVIKPRTMTAAEQQEAMSVVYTPKPPPAPAKPQPPRQPHTFTEKDDRRIKHMRDNDRLMFDEIALRYYGRSAADVAERYYRLTDARAVALAKKQTATTLAKKTRYDFTKEYANDPHAQPSVIVGMPETHYEAADIVSHIDESARHPQSYPEGIEIPNSTAQTEISVNGHGRDADADAFELELDDSDDELLNFNPENVTVTLMAEHRPAKKRRSDVHERARMHSTLAASRNQAGHRRSEEIEPRQATILRTKTFDVHQRSQPVEANTIATIARSQLHDKSTTRESSVSSGKHDSLLDVYQPSTKSSLAVEVVETIESGIGTRPQNTEHQQADVYGTSHEELPSSPPGAIYEAPSTWKQQQMPYFLPLDNSWNVQDTGLQYAPAPFAIDPALLAETSVPQVASPTQPIITVPVQSSSLDNTRESAAGRSTATIKSRRQSRHSQSSSDSEDPDFSPDAQDKIDAAIESDEDREERRKLMRRRLNGIKNPSRRSSSVASEASAGSIGKDVGGQRKVMVTSETHSSHIPGKTTFHSNSARSGPKPIRHSLPARLGSSEDSGLDDPLAGPVVRRPIHSSPPATQARKEAHQMPDASLQEPQAPRSPRDAVVQSSHAEEVARQPPLLTQRSVPDTTEPQKPDDTTIPNGTQGAHAQHLLSARFPRDEHALLRGSENSNLRNPRQTPLAVLQLSAPGASTSLSSLTHSSTLATSARANLERLRASSLAAQANLTKSRMLTKPARFSMDGKPLRAFAVKPARPSLPAKLSTAASSDDDLA